MTGWRRLIWWRWIRRLWYERIERIDLVEMDPKVVEACRTYLPENACRLDDARVHIHYDNVLRFLRRCHADYGA